MWWLLIIPIGFILVLYNNKRNQKKLYNRDARSFRKNYMRKREEENKSESKSV